MGSWYRKDTENGTPAHTTGPQAGGSGETRLPASQVARVGRRRRVTTHAWLDTYLSSVKLRGIARRGTKGHNPSGEDTL